MSRPALIVHGGAGSVPVAERPQRQASVERALAAGWALIGEGALTAAVAAVRQMEDEPLLNAGIGAVLNTAGARPGQSLAVFGVGGVGCCAVAGAFLSGCQPIIAVDVNP